MIALPQSDFTVNSLKSIKTEEISFNEKDQSDSGKFKFILSILKKVIGVGDILNLRISLPSQVLDPVPNLEYFHWLDRPDYFANLSEPEDPVERFVGVVRYSLTRYVKYLNNKLCKPYNSIIGEQFLCHFNTSLPESGKNVRVNMVNEQISHHPPVSAFWYECPETGVTAQGHDHLSARFTGTTVKISPGSFARGIYINLSKRDNEEYHMTHCSAYVHGFLTGSLGIGLSDQVVISCSLTGLRAVYEFKTESWIGKNKYAIEGIIYRFQPTSSEGTSDADLPPANFKFSDIKDQDLVATINGSWRDKINIVYNGTKNKSEILIDMGSLESIPKIIKPQEQMGPMESRVVWSEVTASIHAREFSRATKAKIALEEKQRELARQREETGTVWEPAFFYTKSGKEHKPYLKSNVELNY